MNNATNIAQPQARVVCLHGWAYGPEIWDGVKAALPGVEILTPNLGFFGEENLDIPAFDGPTIAVGHSLGGLYLLHECPFVWDRLLLVNSFPRFTESPDFKNGVKGRFIDRMLRMVERDPLAVLRDFRARCGDNSAPHNDPNVEALTQGLHWLRDWDARTNLGQESAVKVIAGTEDQIAPPALTDEAFQGLEVIYAKNSGHLIPFSHSHTLAAAIGEWLL